MTTAEEVPFRSGFACLVGRPNAGKSTLTNALVGEKIAITSAKPQTTRHAIRGVLTRANAQLIIIDTPGLHRPRTLLGQRLNDVVRSTLTEVDVIGFCLPADQKVGPGDRYIAQELAAIRREGRGTPVIAICTKTDLSSPEQVMQHLLSVERLGDWDDIIPVSAVGEFQVGLVADLLIRQLPPGPALYPDGHLTDEPESILIAELIREAALEGVRDELPHSLAVVVDELSPRPDRPEHNPLLDIRVHLFVERPSQKAIIIGRQGGRLREIGTRSRTAIEALLGQRVYLDLQVKVAKDWQRNPKQLHRLGF